MPGYSGPPELTAPRLLTAWTLDLTALLVLLAFAAAYAAGVVALRRRGDRWPVGRSVSFAAGLAVLLVATCGFPGVYAHVLFWIFVVQICLLLLAGPMLLGLGAPVSLAKAALSERSLHWTRRRGARWLWQAARLPGLAPLILIVVTSALFFTSWMPYALSHSGAYHGLQLLLLAIGMLIVLPVTDEGLLLSSFAYAVMVGVTFVEFLLDAIPGIVLRFTGHLIAPEYWLAVGRPWGLSPIDDQHRAGSWLWFFGEFVDVPFIAVLVLAWIKSDAREAAVVDRELDLAQIAVTPAADDEPAALMRPWWETDASVLGEDRARRHGWSTGRPGP